MYQTHFVEFGDDAPYRRPRPVGDAMDTISFLDVFAGAGGLSAGLSQAGWSPLLAVDNWSDALSTHSRNVDGAVLEADITDIAFVAKVSSALAEQPDWIVGGPPCQGYSTVGKRLRDDDRNRLFLAYRDLIAHVQPAGFVLENVLGMRDMKYVAAVRAAFSEVGYAVTARIVTAADYGVPQLRRRILFVGHREAGWFLGPSPTHSPGGYVSVDDAIGDLPVLAAGQQSEVYDTEPYTGFQKEMRDGSIAPVGHRAVAHLEHIVEAIRHIPDGGNRTSIPDHLQPSSGFHNSYSRLASWKPAVAITRNLAKPSATRCIHRTQDRALTTREGARLQSFPDRFLFSGGDVSQRLQIANAVPPLLAEALGRAIRDKSRWGNSEPIVARTGLLPDDHLER